MYWYLYIYTFSAILSKAAYMNNDSTTHTHTHTYSVFCILVFFSRKERAPKWCNYHRCSRRNGIGFRETRHRGLNEGWVSLASVYRFDKRHTYVYLRTICIIYRELSLTHILPVYTWAAAVSVWSRVRALTPGGGNWG